MRLFAPLAAAVLLAAGVAGASTTRTDRVTANVHSAGHDDRGLIYRGAVRSRVFGAGTVIEHVGGLGLRGTFFIRYGRGTVHGRSVAHAHPRSDGSLAFTGTYTLTGGTRAYRHVRGHGTFSGHGPADLSSATFTQRGRVSY
jgi:hypothetical protein